MEQTSICVNCKNKIIDVNISLDCNHLCRKCYLQLELNEHIQCPECSKEFPRLDNSRFDEMVYLLTHILDGGSDFAEMMI